MCFENNCCSFWQKTSPIRGSARKKSSQHTADQVSHFRKKNSLNIVAFFHCHPVEPWSRPVSQEHVTHSDLGKRREYEVLKTVRQLWDHHETISFLTIRYMWTAEGEGPAIRTFQKWGLSSAWQQASSPQASVSCAKLNFFLCPSILTLKRTNGMESRAMQI
jgi:hypothetical protein